MTSDPEIIEEITTPQYHATGVEGVQITDQMRRFLQMALDGKLPDPGPVPEVDPLVAQLAAELVEVHLPEWRNPAGRKIADPLTVRVPQAPRLAAYLVARGWAHDPARETVRWIPTPGGAPDDQGMHIHPDENGNWPDPDPEAFYDIADVQVSQGEDGRWIAFHPRGIQFEASAKSEAYEGITARLRAKIEEAKA